MRHGETEANRARRIQGQDDTPLTAHAIRATRAMAAKLAALEETTLAGGKSGESSASRSPNTLPDWPHQYCSPLQRARDTLGHLRTHLGLTETPVSYDPRLMEIDFGEHTGRPVDEVLELILHHKRHPWQAYPGGESGQDLQNRVLEFVAEISARHAGERVLVMTHFGVIETVLRHYLRIPTEQPVRPQHDQLFRVELSDTQPAVVTQL